MANATTAAGDNGVAASESQGALPDAVVTGDLLSGGSATENTAIRHSVSKTSGGASASGVFSETQSLRFAYSGVEADSPAITRT